MVAARSLISAGIVSSPVHSYSEDPTRPGPIALHNGRIDDDNLWREVVRNTMIACADLVFLMKDRHGTLRRKLFLARRSASPMPGVWIFGGRLPFDSVSLQAGLARVIKREVGLDLDPARFQFVALNLYTWAYVAQGDFPGRNMAPAFACILSEEERGIAAKTLDGKEYHPGSFRGYTRQDLVKEVKENKGHPMLVDLFDSIFDRPRKRGKRSRKNKK